jgi:nucleotide-binding universal stress UspA family protein
VLIVDEDSNGSGRQAGWTAPVNGPEVTGFQAPLAAIITGMDTVVEWMTGASATQHVRSDGVRKGAPADPLIGLSRLLLATDLSPVSERASEEAVRLAIDSSAELVVLSVVDPGRLRLPGGVFVRRVDQERTRIERQVQELVNRARQAGVRATFLVWEGDPAEAIVAASEAENADAIVLGSHGRGLLGRLVLGSVSARVAERARCRVLVVGA